MKGRHAKPYDPATDSATPTPDPRHCYRGKRRGVPSKHDRASAENAAGATFCHTCAYVGRYSEAGRPLRVRDRRRDNLRRLHEARKADLLGQVDALPRLQLVAGGGS